MIKYRYLRRPPKADRRQPREHKTRLRNTAPPAERCWTSINVKGINDGNHWCCHDYAGLIPVLIVVVAALMTPVADKCHLQMPWRCVHAVCMSSLHNRIGSLIESGLRYTASLSIHSSFSTINSFFFLFLPSLLSFLSFLSLFFCFLLILLFSHQSVINDRNRGFIQFRLMIDNQPVEGCLRYVPQWVFFLTTTWSKGAYPGLLACK